MFVAACFGALTPSGRTPVRGLVLSFDLGAESTSPRRAMLSSRLRRLRGPVALQHVQMGVMRTEEIQDDGALPVLHGTAAIFDIPRFL